MGGSGSRPIRKYYFGCVCVTLIAAMIVFVAEMLTRGQEELRLEPINFRTAQCNMAEARRADEFRAYVLNGWVAHQLSTGLCGASELNADFSGIQVQWGRPHASVFSDFLSAKYDLLIFNREILSGDYLPQGDYSIVAQYPDYGSYLVALDRLPELSLEYLAGKRVGVIGSAFSESGNRALRLWLNQAGIDLSSVNLVELESHASLRAALEDGSVDLIGSFWTDADRAKMARGKALKIGVAPGLAWLMKKEHVGSPIHCLVTKSLVEIAGQSRHEYFSDLQVTLPCRR